MAIGYDRIADFRSSGEISLPATFKMSRKVFQMRSYSRRNPVLFRQRSLWKRAWPVLLMAILLITQKSINAPLADWIAKMAQSIGGRKQVASAHDQKLAQNAQWEIWALRQQIERLQVQERAHPISHPDFQDAYGKARSFERQHVRTTVRDPGEWASFVWVQLPAEQSAKNWLECPAIIGDCAVGLVDFVKGERCRVRLLSDAQVSLSVTTPRALGSENQDDDREKTCSPLIGQVRGFGGALWCSSGTLLAGEGYIPGPPKSALWAHLQKTPAKRQFAVGDLLVTSGLDGIFPTGLRVGVVTCVETAKLAETRYAFAIQSAVNLHQIDEICLLKKATSH